MRCCSSLYLPYSSAAPQVLLLFALAVLVVLDAEDGVTDGEGSAAWMDGSCGVFSGMVENRRESADG